MLLRLVLSEIFWKTACSSVFHNFCTEIANLHGVTLDQGNKSQSLVVWQLSGTEDRAQTQKLSLYGYIYCWQEYINCLSSQTPLPGITPCLPRPQSSSPFSCLPLCPFIYGQTEPFPGFLLVTWLPLPQNLCSCCPQAQNFLALNSIDPNPCCFSCFSLPPPSRSSDCPQKEIISPSFPLQYIFCTSVITFITLYFDCFTLQQLPFSFVHCFISLTHLKAS